MMAELIYELLKDDHRSGRELPRSHKPHYKYTESGVKRIMKATIQMGDYRGRIRICEIRKIYLPEGSSELWATPVSAIYAQYYPLDCVWYPIIPIRKSTLDHLETLRFIGEI